MVTDVIFLGSKITADGNFRHEIKRCFLLRCEAMSDLDSVLKSIVMYHCESWTVKKAECQRTDAFELWCWRRLLRVPWTAKRSNQSILKEVSLEYSLERLMIKVKMQYFGHQM